MKERKELTEDSIPIDLNLLSWVESKDGGQLGLATGMTRLHGVKRIKKFETFIEAHGAILRGTKDTFEKLFDEQRNDCTNKQR